MSPAPEHTRAIDLAVRWLLGPRRCSVAFGELQVGACPIVFDAIGWTKIGDSHAVEVKVTRDDFHADARKKIARKSPLDAPGRFRWYVTPAGLVRPDEVPDQWGLAVVRAKGDGLRVVKEPSQIRIGSVGDDRERILLVAALRRHALRIDFDPERGRFESYDSVLEKRTGHTLPG